MTLYTPDTPAGRHRERLAPLPHTGLMLSRVAASLYWMSRYLERAENVARMLDVNLQLMIDFGSLDDQSVSEHWLPLLNSTGDEDLFFQLYDQATSENVTEFMTFRKENRNSLCNCIANARENARQVRDQISYEMWEVLNECHLFLRSTNARQIWDNGASSFYDQIKRFSHLFQGLTDSTFSRGEGWNYICFGKYVERADKTARILDLKYHILLPKATDVGGAVDTAQWQALLRSASALEAYRRFYVAEILPWKVSEFLILSEDFPRSIRYCVDRIDEALHRINGTDEDEYPSPAEKAFGRLRSDLRFFTMDDVFRIGLHEYLQNVQQGLDRISQHVYETFMYHPPIDLAAEIRLHQQEQQQQQ